MNNVFELNHPLIKHKLGILRDKNTKSSDFRKLTSELSLFLAYEATKDLKLSEKQIETPISSAKVEKIENAPVIVSIMRAGNGMLDAMLTALPFSSAGFIGAFRDKSKNEIVEYYYKVPENIEDKEILLIDPMLASGDTAIAAIKRLQQSKVGQIKLITLLTCKKGTDKVLREFPKTKIYTLSADEELNEKGYLVPGLGDAGDRIFGTN